MTLQTGWRRIPSGSAATCPVEVGDCSSKGPSPACRPSPGGGGAQTSGQASSALLFPTMTLTCPKPPSRGPPVLSGTGAQEGPEVGWDAAATQARIPRPCPQAQPSLPRPRGKPSGRVQLTSENQPPPLPDQPRGQGPHLLSAWTCSLGCRGVLCEGAVGNSPEGGPGCQREMWAVPATARDARPAGRPWALPLPKPDVCGSWGLRHPDPQLQLLLHARRGLSWA